MQSAITIIDPYTGNIVAMAGGMGEKQGSRLFNYATARRQCGSAIKPIAAYAPALDNGTITPASVLDDAPVRTLNGKAWPVNSHPYYDGLVTVDYAIAQSLNPCAVRVVEALGVQASYDYMTDKLGTGWEEDIEKVVKLSQIADITFDCLRAIAFDLKQGYPLEETLMDLNINYERNSSYDVTVRLSNGWITTAYYKKIDLYSKDECNISFEKDGIRYWITFSPSDATVADGALAVNPQKIKLTLAYDAFEESMSDDDAEIARRQWMKNTTVESCTLTKVSISMVNKFDNF